MHKTEKYTEGLDYILDAKLLTGGTVTLLKIYNDTHGRVQDTENKSDEWDIALCRLSDITTKTK